MTATEMFKVLFVQALEESDPHGHHLPLSTRHHATQQARNQEHPPSDNFTNCTSFLTKRAEIIWTYLNRAFPALAPPGDRLHGNFPTWLAVIPAMGFGLMINGFGDSQRVNLLNFPLLLLLFWNVGLYLVTAVMPLLGAPEKTPWLETATLWLSKTSELWGQRPWPLRNLGSSATTPWIREATRRFMTLWWPHIKPVWTQRVRYLLHLAAASMALGIVVGLYVRGLALDYQATWESTFLSAAQVQAFLYTLLGPASWVLQYPFPTVAELVSLEAPHHGPAAPWIHMWALTAFALIVIPRSIMGWRCQHRATKTTFVLPLRDPYFVHLLAPDKGQGIHVDVVPYSYEPSSTAKNFLDLMLLDLFGNLATISWKPPVAFGQEFSRESISTSTPTIVALFNAGQTPEGEVHGEWLHSLQTQMDSARSQAQLLILLDEESYSTAVDRSRVLERRQTWLRLGKQYHLALVPFTPSDTMQDQVLQQAQAGLWPRSS